MSVCVCALARVFLCAWELKRISILCETRLSFCIERLVLFTVEMAAMLSTPMLRPTPHTHTGKSITYHDHIDAQYPTD